MLSRPKDRVTGSASFDVASGFISKSHVSVRADDMYEGWMLSKNFEFNLTRAVGNTFKIQMPAPNPPPALVAKGKIVFQKSSSLLASDPPNPTRLGTYQKIFEVQLTAGKTYVMDLKHPPTSTLDPYLRLEDAKGKILAEDDDSGGNLDARIVFKAPQTGMYRLAATSFQVKMTGAFILTVTELEGAGAVKPKTNPAPGNPNPANRLFFQWAKVGR